MPEKLTFNVIGVKPKRSFTTTDYHYEMMSNGRFVAVAVDPETKRRATRFVKQDLLSASEIAKLPKFVSSAKGKARKSGGSRKSRRSGSRKSARR